MIERVRCANCGMIYDRRKPLGLAVDELLPDVAMGLTNVCPGCGSNAADPIAPQPKWENAYTPTVTDGAP